MNMWDFFNQHEFLAWCALWLTWLMIPAMQTILLLVNRTYRAINILFHGWPPAHLDADGDFVKIEGVK